MIVARGASSYVAEEESVSFCPCISLGDSERGGLTSGCEA